MPEAQGLRCVGSQLESRLIVGFCSPDMLSTPFDADICQLFDSLHTGAQIRIRCG